MVSLFLSLWGRNIRWELYGYQFNSMIAALPLPLRFRVILIIKKSTLPLYLLLILVERWNRSSILHILLKVPGFIGFRNFDITSVGFAFYPKLSYISRIELILIRRLTPLTHLSFIYVTNYQLDLVNFTLIYLNPPVLFPTRVVVCCCKY